MSIKDTYTKTCFNKILKADRVYDVATITPLQSAPKISSKFMGSNFWYRSSYVFWKRLRWRCVAKSRNRPIKTSVWRCNIIDKKAF